MWLVGMMGSGKTSVGRLTADRLGVAFYDTDEAIATRARATITEIWDQLGEAHFRELERAAIAAKPPGVVAAAGGGAVLDANNRRRMLESPPVIWLHADPETLALRVGAAENRPLLTIPSRRVDELRQILDDRREDYAAAATHTVDTDDRSVEEIAEEVSQLWSG